MMILKNLAFFSKYTNDDVASLNLNMNKLFSTAFHIKNMKTKA